MIGKRHVVLNDARYKLGGKTETLCGREGVLNFPRFEDGPHLKTAANTNLPIATQANPKDARFCAQCRKLWRKITSAV